MALQIFGNTYDLKEKVLKASAKEAFLYLDDDFEVNFRFISESKMKELNKIFRKKDVVTDVLSFKLDDEQSGGDVVICYQELKREAKTWGMTKTEATAFLLVHGILHLAGFDHTDESSRVRMEKAEDMILKTKGIKIER